MFLVLLDEPGLSVFASPVDAARSIEPIDAESEIRAAFDESGVPYAVDWVRPSRRRKTLFGLISWIEMGAYRFVPAGPPNPAALAELLEAHTEYTEPAEAKSDLTALLSRLRAV
jgi:hypothetical protein